MIMFLCKLIFVLALINFGYSERQPYTSRIINGTKIEEPDQFSQAMASIQVNENHACGGTILSSNLVLTAAHCLSYDPETMMVLTSTLNTKRGGRKYKVQSLILHEDFDMKKNMRNDIGIIKVKPDFLLTDGEQKIKLPKKNEKFAPGTTATIVGWGRVSELQRTNILRKVDQKIISNKECSKRIKYPLFDGEICSGTSTESRTGFCKGDSGGPVFINGTQVGVVSWYVKTCGEKPNVFANIAYYMDWITANIGLHSH